MAITSRVSLMQNLAAGKGVILPFDTTNGASPTTTQNAGDGFMFAQIQPNNIGTTLQATLQTFTLPTGLSSEMFLQFFGAGSGVSSARGMYLARLYKFGTQVLGSTGDQFTHDAATFPVTRTQFGVASQPVSLLPFIQLTTAPTVTAPAVILNTVAAGAGYKNQDGNNIVGANTLTYPSATTAVGTSYFLKLNYGDSAVQDIIAIQTTTAGTSSPAATVWGVELLCPLFMYLSIVPTFQDTLGAGLNQVNLAPAVATSGTVTSVLAIVGLCNTTEQWSGWICGALNA